MSGDSPDPAVFPETGERPAIDGRDDDLPRVTRLAAYGVIVDGERILLCRVSPGNLGTGFWVLPGGGLDFGESPERGVVREVEEETGLLAEITGPPVVHSDAGVWERRAGDVRFHHVRFVYPMQVIGGQERLEVDGSTDAFEWVALDGLDERRLGDLVDRVLQNVDAFRR